MKEMLVSFIIPAYNAADTIERCLNSIYALSLKREEFEVIVIDDASTDTTRDTVSFYQSKYPNITLLRQPENHRQGAARNRGVKIAKGEYICFVDADDAVTEGIIDAIRLAKEKDADMVAFHYGNANEKGEMTSEAKRLSFKNGQIFTGIEMQNKHPYWCSGPVAYIYNKDFLEKVNYPFVEGVLYEDSDFVANHLYRAKRMTYSSELGYKAYYREGSTTHSSTYKNVADYLLLGTRMMALYERIISEGVSELMSEGVSKFAEGILEGACFNLERSCRRLLKLNRAADVRAYYERVDANVNRWEIVVNKRYRSYYWNQWTRLCMQNKRLTIIASTIMRPIYKLLKK